MKTIEIKDKFLWETLVKCSKDVGEIPEYLLQVFYEELLDTNWSYNQVYSMLDLFHGQY